MKELKPDALAAVKAELRLERAIERTLASLRASRAVTVVLNDPQRATASAAVLLPLAAALPATRWRALVAAGSHHFPPRRMAEYERRLRGILPLERIAWHDCLSDELIELSGEWPWRCHPWLLEDDHTLLAIGSCEPHYFAGITGAHKTVTIGCADYGGIQRNHAQALSEHARPGVLEGNPVHESVAAMVRSLEARREVLTVNLIQIGPAIVAASAGWPLETLASIAPLVRARCFCRIPAAAEALVLEVTGPLGASFYQADKGIKNSECAVRDGGALVLLADCPDGAGQDDFLRLLRECPTYDAIIRTVSRDGYRLGDHKAVKLRYLTGRRGVRVFVVGDGISQAEAELLGLTKAQSADSALAAAGVDPSAEGVYRVADAGNTCVIVA